MKDIKQVREYMKNPKGKRPSVVDYVLGSQDIFNYLGIRKLMGERK